MNVFDKKIFNDCAGFGITETPSFNLSVVPVAGTEVLFGKQVSELQSNISTNSGEVIGTLHYVTGYTGFSGKVSEQSGHYLALKATAMAGTVITATLVGGSGKIVTLDEDGMIVFRITATTQKVQFMATKDGETYTMTLPLTNVVLIPQLSLIVSAVTDNRNLFGKVASDLQENIVVTSSAITGTSKYVDDYTGFSGDVSEQSGNYIALIAEPNIAGATVVYHGTNGDVTLDSDHTIVIRIINENARQFTATYDTQTVNVSLDISGLTLIPAPQPAGLTPFSVGQTVSGVDFGDVQNGDISPEMDNFLANLTYTEGKVTLVKANQTDDPEKEDEVAFAIDLSAMTGGSIQGYCIQVSGTESHEPAIPYSTVAFSMGYQFVHGYNELSNGKIALETTQITYVSPEQGWNGTLIGAEEAQA